MGSWSVFREKSNLCRSAEDRAFHVKYLEPLRHERTLPLRWEKHPRIAPADFAE
ncbi:MAG: hypothetical protein M5R36_09785 [Deltaproteobacteria bacterium]|nr:hypothetical protein [Deltaproteobacteria bacterium]